LELFRRGQPEDSILIGELALINMGLGDEATAWALAERGMALRPIEKDALEGSARIESLARVAAGTGEPDRAIAALQKLLSIPGAGHLSPNPYRSLVRCSASIRCSIRYATIRVSKR